MKFDNKSSKGVRPVSFWNSGANSIPLDRNLTPVHQHEFGNGYDIQYKDNSGKIQAELHGLTPAETTYLKSIKGKF